MGQKKIKQGKLVGATTRLENHKRFQIIFQEVRLKTCEELS